MQVTPRNKQLGRRQGRCAVIERQTDPTPVTLTEDEKRRRLYNRGW